MYRVLDGCGGSQGLGLGLGSTRKRQTDPMEAFNAMLTKYGSTRGCASEHLGRRAGRQRFGNGGVYNNGSNPGMCGGGGSSDGSGDSSDGGGSQEGGGSVPTARRTALLLSSALTPPSHRPATRFTYIP
jgi:hypothetical protein